MVRSLFTRETAWGWGYLLVMEIRRSLDAWC